jgi:general secretion pathway protein E
VLAQRLVRKLCPACKKPHQITASEREWLAMEEDDTTTIYSANGCELCNYQGYEGRTGLYELVPVDEKLQDMIHDGEGEHAMEKYARTKTSSLRQDGKRMILEGITSLEEVLRVSRED